MLCKICMNDENVQNNYNFQNVFQNSDWIKNNIFLQNKVYTEIPLGRLVENVLNKTVRDHHTVH